MARRILKGANRERYRAIRDRMFVAGIMSLRRVLGWMGFQRAGRLGEAFGDLAGRFLSEPREIALEQLAAALPERPAVERDRIVKTMFRGLGRSVAEIALMDRIAHRLDDHVEAEGLELMDQALARGRGVIAVTGHIGNWELLAAFFGLKGYPVTVIATPVKGKALNQANIDLRRAANVETVARDGPGSSKAILRTLKQGRILAILMDQDTHGQGVVVPFLGRPAFTPVGPAALAWRTGAAIVGVFIHRDVQGRHHIKVVEPSLPDRCGEDVEARAAWHLDTTAELTRLIENEVRARPDEWVWWHRRWNREGQASA